MKVKKWMAAIAFVMFISGTFIQEAFAETWKMCIRDRYKPPPLGGRASAAFLFPILTDVSGGDFGGHGPARQIDTSTVLLKYQ